MTFSYEINDDVRFQNDFSEKYVQLLNDHGFPLVEEQPKDVHKLGRGVGLELNSLNEKIKQLFRQTKLQISQGDEIDWFASQFNIYREFGETDNNFRKRVQAQFYPRKITEPNIQQTLNDLFSNNQNLPQLITPWRSIITYDYPANTINTYDGLNGRLWSPDYWRAAVLVVRTELNTNIRKIVESLIAIGVLVLYEQYLYDFLDLNLTNRKEYQRQWTYETERFKGAIYDKINYDIGYYTYDNSDFVRGWDYSSESNFAIDEMTLQQLNYQYDENFETIQLDLDTLNDLYKFYETFYMKEFLKFNETLTVIFNGTEYVDEYIRFVDTISSLVEIGTLFNDDPLAEDDIVLQYESDSTTVDLFLDNKPQIFAGYSMRKLSNTQSGNILRVRKVSDSTQINIGVVNTVLDYTTLLNFAAGDSVNLFGWFDQIPPSLTFNAVNNPASLVVNGVINEDDTSLLPCFKLSGSSDLRVSTADWLHNKTNFGAIFIIKPEFNTSEQSLFKVPNVFEITLTRFGALKFYWFLNTTFTKTTPDNTVTFDSWQSIGVTFDLINQTVLVLNGADIVFEFNLVNFNTQTLIGNRTFELFKTFKGSFLETFLHYETNKYVLGSWLTDLNRYWNIDNLEYTSVNNLTNEITQTLLTEDGQTLLIE